MGRTEKAKAKTAELVRPDHTFPQQTAIIAAAWQDMSQSWSDQIGPISATESSGTG
jgi:hypothetical protein